MADVKLNIYQKLARARAELKKRGLSQSGKNTYSNYTYFELKDFLPAISEIEASLDMLSVVRFYTEKATLTCYNCEKPEESIVFEMPMSDAELKGCHAVQNLGAVETYIRRYLYNIAYEIAESDGLDGQVGKPEPEKKETGKKETGKKETGKKEGIKPKEPTPREKLIAALHKKGIDINVYAKEKGLSGETTPERFTELLAELEDVKNEN